MWSHVASPVLRALRGNRSFYRAQMAEHVRNGAFRVVPVPNLADNYAYLLIDEGTSHCAVVDPGEHSPIIAAAEREKVEIVAVLATHHHWDHVGGVEKLVAAKGIKKVFGGDDRIPALTTKVKNEDSFKIGGIEVHVRFTPCHTTGHVLYYVPRASPGKQGAVFTGDTLFIGGCGRFFEGTAEQMDYALNKDVASLPDDTQVYCGHEYTVKNLEFALTVDPANEALKEKLRWAKERRQQGLPTIPSDVGQEKSFNPFMRVDTDDIKSSLRLTSGSRVDVMQALRELKNSY